jgi:hypothetical protein
LWWLNGAEIYGLESPSWMKRAPAASGKKGAVAVRVTSNGAKPGTKKRAGARASANGAKPAAKKRKTARVRR